MNQERITRTLEAAKTVSKILRESNVRCMVIGAAALAVHGYARQSVDLDLATYENPFETFDLLAKKLLAAGFQVELIKPDADDPLGGAINITGPDFDPVQVINFMNPLHPQRVHQLVGEALAELNTTSEELQVVSIELLIMLKLYAGDAQSLSDVHKLLEANPDLNKAKLEEVAHASGLDHAWHKFIS